MSRELMAVGSFLTLCYVRIDVRNQRLICVDCGHTGVLHRAAGGGGWRTVRGTNMPLGFLPGERFEEVSAGIAPGDLIVLFSDGITEAVRADGERFGEQRLMAVVDRCGEAEPRGIIEAIRLAVLAFAGPDGFADDVTCLVVRIAATQDPRTLATSDLALTSDLERLPAVRTALTAFLALENVPCLTERERDRLLLAVQEAAANIVAHAYRGEAGRPLEVRFEAFPDALRVTLWHLGDAFVPAPAPDPSGSGPQQAESGLLRIAAAVDSCRYDRDDSGRNRVVLDKHLPGKGPSV